MSNKRKESTTSQASKLSKQAKIPKPTFSLVTLLDEIEKLTEPVDIEKRALKLRDDLIGEWNKGKLRDMNHVEMYLEAAKVLLTKFSFLPLAVTTANNAKDLRIARDILEVGALFSVTKSEKEYNEAGMKEFERYISQLKHYYFDFRKYFQPDSPHMYEILGMNLLNLLSQNRISEFHTELELFIHPNVDEVLANPYIKKAVEIEQFIMEGQYNKIYELKKADLNPAGITSPGFKYFIDHLENMLKEHTTGIADVVGAAYDKLSMQSAMHVLNLTDSNKMANIIHKQNWIAKEGYIYFHTKKDASETIPAKELVQNALMYSNELDTIV